LIKKGGSAAFFIWRSSAIIALASGGLLVEFTLNC
jgi:hypothetical protein